MEVSVRAFVMNAEDEILLAKHDSGELWTLPGGHVETGEGLFSALKREIDEEFGIDVTIIGSDTDFSSHNVASLPLPISIHTIKYEHRTKGPVEKIEYVFFARTDDDIERVDDEEIFAWQWVSGEDLYAMEPQREIHLFIQELFEQNEDLLEIL